jgi:DNA topoisomerase-3
MAWGWGCSGYTDGCKFKFGAAICGKKISDETAKDLISKGETSVVKGFVSKAGKKFDAKLKIVSGEVKFEFEKR